MEKALQYAYRDRKAKKRDMRSLWIQRVNAASKEHGVRSHHPVGHVRRPPCLPHHILVPTHSMQLMPDFYLTLHTSCASLRIRTEALMAGC